MAWEPPARKPASTDDRFASAGFGFTPVPDGPGSRNLRALHQGRVEAKGVRSGREPSVSRTELPEPSVSCRSRSASKSRSFSLMGSAASPRRNSLLLSRILCISKGIRLWGVAQELSSEALPTIGQTVTGHKSPKLFAARGLLRLEANRSKSLRPLKRLRWTSAQPPDRQSATLRPGKRSRSLSWVTRVRS